MPRVSSSAAIFTRGLLLGLGLELSAFVIDNDEMKSRSLEQTNEVGHTCETRIAFGRHNQVEWRRGSECHLALA